MAFLHLFMVLTLANVSISGETGDGEITNDFIEETREKKSEMPNILLESFEGNFPSIYLNKTEENSLRTSQDEDECSELSVSVTSDSFETSSVSEINNNFDEKNNSVTRMDGSSGGIVKDDDVITDDVTGGDVTSDDVMSSDINDDVISDVKSSDAISNDVSNDDAKGDKNVANDVIDKDLIRSDVIGDDIIPINTGEYVNYVSKSIDNDSCVDPSDKLPESMESNEVRTKCGQLACDNTPLASAHVEITITEDNSTVQHDFIDISNFCDEKNVAKSDDKHSDLSENIINIAEAQDEQAFIKKGVEEKDGGCKCFHKTKDIASEEQHQSEEHIEDSSVDFREQMNSSDVTRTIMDSKESYGISDRSNPSKATQDSSEVTETSEDNSVEKLENSSFASQTPLLTTSSNTADNFFDSNEQRTEDDASEPKNHDSSQSLVNKSYNSNPSYGNPLQSNFKTLDRTENVSISINCPSSENIDTNEMSNGQNNSDSLEKSSNVSLSTVEDRTSQNISDGGIFDKNKIPQNAVEISSSDVKLSEIEEQTIFDVLKTSFSDDLKIDDETSYINDNIDDKNLPQELENAATVENTPISHDIRILTVEDSDISESIKSERNFLPRSVRERTSSANSFASSDFSVESGTKSSFADEQEPQMADDEMDLSSKAGMDKFKEFLMDTKGEALLLFWLEVETWKHIGDSGDKMRCVVGLCGSFSQLN